MCRTIFGRAGPAKPIHQASRTSSGSLAILLAVLAPHPSDKATLDAATHCASDRKSYTNRKNSRPASEDRHRPARFFYFTPG